MSDRQIDRQIDRQQGLYYPLVCFFGNPCHSCLFRSIPLIDRGTRYVDRQVDRSIARVVLSSCFNNKPTFTKKKKQKIEIGGSHSCSPDYVHDLWYRQRQWQGGHRKKSLLFQQIRKSHVLKTRLGKHGKEGAKKTFSLF